MVTLPTPTAPKRFVASGATLSVAAIGLYLLALAAVPGAVDTAPAAVAGGADLVIAVGTWRLYRRFKASASGLDPEAVH